MGPLNSFQLFSGPVDLSDAVRADGHFLLSYGPHDDTHEAYDREDARYKSDREDITQHSPAAERIDPWAIITIKRA